MATILASVVLLLLVVAMFATRILLVKDGEFRGTCSSNNPFLKNELGECTVCGQKPGGPCLSEEAAA